MMNQDINQANYIPESNTSNAPSVTYQKEGSTQYIIQHLYADGGKTLKHILEYLLLQNYK